MDHPNRAATGPIGLRGAAVGLTAVALTLAACAATTPSPPAPTASVAPRRLRPRPRPSSRPRPRPRRARRRPRPRRRPPIPRNPAAVDEAVAVPPGHRPGRLLARPSTTRSCRWVPGTTFVYEGDGERIEVTVTADTRTVMGVDDGRGPRHGDRRRASSPRTRPTGTPRIAAGNVWYFGEATLSFEDDPAGDPAGSWEAGVDGAQPGIVMLADPRGGDVLSPGVPQGRGRGPRARLGASTASIKVRAGSYDGLLVTEEWTPLEPDTVEYKYYARGVGIVAERVVVGGNDLVELVEVRQPGN